MTSIIRTGSVTTLLALGLALAPGCPATAQPEHGVATVRQAGFSVTRGRDHIEVQVIAPGIVHVHYLPDGEVSPPSLVIDPHASWPVFEQARVAREAAGLTVTTGQLSVRWSKATSQLSIEDARHKRLLKLDLAPMAKGHVSLHHATDDALYGLRGYNATEKASAGLLRSGDIVAKAGAQGHAGAPFVWSTAGYGVMVDTDGADFVLGKQQISVSKSSKKDLDLYVFVGTPARIFGDLAKVSGHTPMFPKWAMGFTNSQWGIDQKELLQIVDTYRAKHIPIDNFTLDFDWKAWGDDNYGEFRWNPVKFPAGPSGKLKRMLDAKGIQLTGIMKPRLHVDTVEGRYATAHDLWMPGEKASKDYFSHKLVRDLDFDKPAARAWFGHLAMKYAFDKGIVGWWNDEADETGDNTQFMNMERSLYDAQRAASTLRVWSINRDFYLGAQRYAYGLWSGDIATGFDSMAAQRVRMLSAINVGAMQWGMDGGGFKGHPSNENYARWIEFGAFTPIFRVHGTFDEKRQPWVYGPIAEKAATAAIRLRYALIPYIYSYEYQRHVSGVGLVRPLLFDWPLDPRVRNDTAAWMFGKYLLVSPVVKQGQKEKHIYLPAGEWTDWFSGKHYAGGQAIVHTVDAQNWSDIPLYIRAGAIIPLQPPMDYVGEKPLTEVTVEVFPAASRSSFDYYDDDGRTYAYEQGSYFLQTLTTQRHGQNVQFATGKPRGGFKPRLAFYLLKIHGNDATAVRCNGKALASFGDLAALRGGHGEGWATGHDRFGPVTYVRVAAAQAKNIKLALSP